MKKASERSSRRGRVRKSLNESKRKEESRGERAREWGGLKANHVPSKGVSLLRVAENGEGERGKERRIAMVSRIRMLRTPYNGHSNELKPWVRTAPFNNGGRRDTIFAIEGDF